MESYKQIFFKEDDERIFPSEGFSFEFDYKTEEFSRYRLFFTGEPETFYWWKSEYCSTAVYKRIGDALVRGKYDAYGVRFVGADYPMLVCRKVGWTPELGYLPLLGHTENWTCGVKASARNIKIKEGGYLRLTVEIRHAREGMLNKQTKYIPDEVIYIDFDEGSYDGRDFGTALVLPDDKTANVQYIIEGEKFEGEIVFEAPYLTSSNGYNVLAPFAPDATMYHRLFNWFGVNLSKTEWPAMQITLNGHEIFKDEFFERCHRYSEKEIEFPEGYLIDGKNKVEFKLITECREPLPYRLHEVGIVRDDKHSFDIISCPETAVAGKEFALLLELSTPCTITVDSDARVTSPVSFVRKGLHALRFVCDGVRNDLNITLSDGESTHTVTVKRVLEREDDGVVTGTGDLIYINQNEEDTMSFFKWYMQNNIGNLLTIRPTYRWSGTRVRNDEMWKEFVALLNSLGMKYVHMLDGREPQGYNANPSISELSIETGDPSGFLGRQLHERDGAYCYWGDYVNSDDFWNNNANYDSEQYFDMLHRIRHNDPDHAGSEFYPEDFFDDGSRYWLCHDPFLPADMEAQAKGVMDSLTKIRKGSTRHTGPSILFKYFLMTGYKWVGAETMDSPTEFLMGALRGASEAYKTENIGVHHALQWSSSPHEDPMRYRRYRLALYVTWMQGSHINNTEEGLWHMEEYFEHHHRHGAAAKAHLAVQQDFFRLVSSHSRQGRVRARVGILHGKYDGYPCFGADAVWGRREYHGFNTKFDAEQSWHIPRQVFYPNGVKGWECFTHKCDGGPIGLVSPNPKGTLNVIPVEEEWGDYPFLCFFGYNKAEKAENDRILRRVREGATLLLTLGHLSISTDRAELESYGHRFEDHPIFTEMGFSGVPEMTESVINGFSARVGVNLTAGESEILARTDDGRPLIVEKAVGNGKIIFFNTVLYPAHPGVKDAYTDKFVEQCDVVNEKERVFPITGDNVQAVVYDLPDGSQAVYMIAVDWWNDPETERELSLRIDGKVYPLFLPFGVMKKALVKDGVAVVCESESADVLSLSDSSFVAQGVGNERFLVLSGGKLTTVSASFTDSPRLVIEL